MKKLNRVIVGIDIAEKSNNVLKRALMLAKQNKAKLVIIHAVPIPWFSVPRYFGGKAISVDIKGITKKIEKKMKTLDPDGKVAYSVLVKEGDADDILLFESKVLKADMLVIGAHSKAKGKKSFLGTTAEKVAHQSYLPVLVVKNYAKEPYGNIVAATDFQEESKQSVLFAKNIFPSAKVSAVYSSELIYVDGPYTVVGRDFEEYNKAVKVAAKNYLKEFMKDTSIKKGKIIDGESNSKKTLLKYINSDAYDLAVVGSRGTTGINALLGSVASTVLREAKMDVLVYVI